MACCIGAAAFYFRRKPVEQVDGNTIHVREVEEGTAPAFMEKKAVFIS